MTRLDEVQLKQAIAELDGASKNLRDAYITWGEALTTMHIAEVALREAQRRVARVTGIIRSSTAE
jgi:hypothetical protein